MNIDRIQLALKQSRINQHLSTDLRVQPFVRLPGLEKSHFLSCLLSVGHHHVIATLPYHLSFSISFPFFLFVAPLGPEFLFSDLPIFYHYL